MVERRGQAELGAIAGVKPVVATTGGGGEMNPAFSIYRNVYNVVETARLTSDSVLSATFSGTSSSVCSNINTIKQYGFAPIGSLCGNTTTFKQGYSL